MKPHPRIRKTIKWGGAALTVLLVVVWIASGWWWLRWGGDQWGRGWRGRWTVGSGTINVCNWTNEFYSNPRGWTVIATPEYHIGNFCSWSTKGDRWEIDIPLWVLVVAAGTASISAFRLDTLARRRALLNLCPNCHYDRTGLAAGAVCPECGTGSGTA